MRSELDNFKWKKSHVLSLVAFCIGGWRCIRVRDTVMNAEAVSKDYGGFAESKRKCLPAGKVRVSLVQLRSAWGVVTWGFIILAERSHFM